MSNWKIGDKALCVNNGLLPYQTADVVGKLPALRLNAKYIVNDIHTCQCGSISLDVGLVQTSNGGIRCSCGTVSDPCDVHWCNATRFVKPQEDKASIEEKINEALKTNDMELIDKLLENYNK